jgi:hypothetical protein
MKFHASYQVFVRTYSGDSGGDDVHVLIVPLCFVDNR